MVYTTPLSYKNQLQEDKAMKNKVLFILCSLVFTGCQINDQKTHQQQEICKTLSEGYLKTQNQQTYEFWKLEQIPNQAEQNTLKLIYKKPNENGLVLTGLLLPTVELECTLKQQHIVVSVAQPTGKNLQVLEVILPKPTNDTPRNPDLVARSETQ